MRRRSLLAFLLPTLAALVTGGLLHAQLKVIELPAGNVRGFSINATGWTGHEKKYQASEWLSQGFEGVLFRGAGADQTRIWPDAMADHTVLVDRHPGVVRFEGVSIYGKGRTGGGNAVAVFFGLNHMDWPIEPKFRLEMADCAVIADPPAAGGRRATWGLFGYQSDVVLDRVTIDWTEGVEHASYWRGFAKTGYRATGCDIPGSGSQGFKFRNSIYESKWVAGAKIILTDCRIEDCGQPWTWRGPGAVVVEGGGCDIIATRVLIKGGVNDFAKSFMVDDAGGDFYSSTNGARGRGYANGHVVLKDCGVYAGPGVENLTPMVRVCGNGPGANLRYIARSVTITGSGLFGARTQLTLGNVPLRKINVQGCNTPAIKALALSLDLDASAETVIPLQHSLLPVSAGYSR